eukprot:4742240-Amphidinium_carterae.3
MESEWNQLQIRQLRPTPIPHVPETGPPTVMPSSQPRLPEMPVIPPGALAEDVDLTDPQFPVFGEWKKTICAAPHALSRDAQLMENYKPVGSNIEGFGAPVDKMMKLTPALGTHVFIPIQWNADCVTPPYPNFYLDGHRIVPCTQGLTGYDGLSLSYTGPMVFEEYWNRMIGLWKRKNEARREHAKMIADMKGVPLEFEEFGEMPYCKRVPEFHRVRRFQLGKLKIMTRDCEEEQAANRRRAAAEQEAIEQALLEHGNASRHITADALRQLQDDTSERARIPKGAPTVNEGGSPKVWKKLMNLHLLRTFCWHAGF